MAATTWTPQPQGLQEILLLLRESTSSHNNEFHRQVNEKLNQLNQHAEFNNYLIYILTQMTSEDEPIRAMAGLVLKNNVAGNYATFHPTVKQYIKECCINCIGDPMVLVRSTISNIITTIVSRGKLHDWPELLPTLMQRLESPEYPVLEGAFCALHRICEDGAREGNVNNEIFGAPLQVMLPVFLRFFSSPHDRIRMYAVSCVMQFYTASPHTPSAPALVQHLPAFIQGLYDHAMDQSVEVRRNVCQALVMLLDKHPQQLMPQMNTIVEYMIMCTQDDEDAVALEACEFWLAAAEIENANVILGPFLQRLVPVLLKRMVYSAIDLQSLSGSRDDSNVPDRPEDIRPRFHMSRSHQQQHLDDVHQRQSMARDATEDGDTDGSDYGDDDDDELYTEWNIRKCSAAALDILATVFQDDILSVFLPLLREILTSQDWTLRECGILALGAVAEGCIRGLDPHLAELIPFLTHNLQDPKPLVRSISCWTLSRYAHWCVHRNHKNLFLQPVLVGLLERILDTNKRVQEAACSAFATFEEEAQVELVPFLDRILQYLMEAFRTYQNKNLVILYDAIGTLADSVGKQLNQDQLIQKLMPPLINKWNSLPDNNHELFPLLECLSSVAMAMGPGFFPFAAPVFDRCIRLISTTLAQLQEYDLLLRAGQTELLERREKPDKDFIVVALDLVSGLAEGLGPSIESLVLACNPPLPNLVHQCLLHFHDTAPEVRQSSFALLGDLSVACFAYMKPFLGEFMPILIKNLEPRLVSVCNNSSWALGEIALQLGGEMRPYVPLIFAPLKSILCRPSDLPPAPRTLQENVAITIGRMGFVCPDIIAPSLQPFFVLWCRVMRNIRDNPEKETAFMGLCAMIKMNPHAIVGDFIFFCDAIVSWNDTPAALHAQFLEILHGFKNSIGPNWAQYYNSFPEDMRRELAEKFQLGPN